MKNRGPVATLASSVLDFIYNNGDGLSIEEQIAALEAAGMVLKSLQSQANAAHAIAIALCNTK